MISGGLDPVNAQQAAQVVEQVYGSGVLQGVYGAAVPAAAQVVDDFAWMNPSDIARSREVFSPATLRYAAMGATAAKVALETVAAAGVATVAAVATLGAVICVSYGYAGYSVLDYYSPETTSRLRSYF